MIPLAFWEQSPTKTYHDRQLRASRALTGDAESPCIVRTVDSIEENLEFLGLPI